MPGQSAQNAETQAAFELKGSTFAIPVLRPLSADVELVSQELADHIQKAPEFFQNAPLIIDLSTVQGQESVTQFALLVGLLRSNGLMPVGVRGGSETQNEVATSMDLAVMGQGMPLKQPKAEWLAKAKFFKKPAFFKAVASVVTDRKANWMARTGFVDLLVGMNAPKKVFERMRKAYKKVEGSDSHVVEKLDAAIAEAK